MLAPDGRPVVGSVDPASFAVFLGRLRTTFSNWPFLLGRLLGDAAGLHGGRLTSRARSGSVLVTPVSRAAWWPVFEMLAEDLYRLGELTDLVSEEGDVILDLGAHVGAAAAVLAKRFPAARVVCVEPNPSAFSYLEENTTRNGIRAHLVNKAVGAVAGTATLYGAEAASCEASTTLARPGERFEVPVVSFEQLVSEASGPVRVVKLDCEGAEHDVVNESDPRAWDDVRLVLVEYHETGREDTSWTSLEERFRQLGFTTSWQMPFAWRPGLGMAGLRRPQDLR